MESGVIKTPISKMWLNEDGIIHEKVNAGSIIELNDAMEEIAAYSALCHDMKRPLFVDIREAKSVSGEARSHLAGEDGAKAISATALLIDSPLSRIMGNFFLGFNKPSYPVKLFSSERRALKWLRGFLE